MSISIPIFVGRDLGFYKGTRGVSGSYYIYLVMYTTIITRKDGVFVVGDMKQNCTNVRGVTFMGLRFGVTHGNFLHLIGGYIGHLTGKEGPRTIMGGLTMFLDSGLLMI